jgi:hypothetical protein
MIEKIFSERILNFLFPERAKMKKRVEALNKEVEEYLNRK